MKYLLYSNKKYWIDYDAKYQCLCAYYPDSLKGSSLYLIRYVKKIINDNRDKRTLEILSIVSIIK